MPVPGTTGEVSDAHEADQRSERTQYALFGAMILTAMVAMYGVMHLGGLMENGAGLRQRGVGDDDS